MKQKTFYVRTPHDENFMNEFIHNLGDRLDEVRQYGKYTFTVIYI